MDDNQVMKTLLLEAHRCIAAAAEEAVAKIGLQRQRPRPDGDKPDLEALLNYPPGHALSDDEERALRSLELSALERAAMQKLVADGCAAAFFHFFNLVDGTGDPELVSMHETWLGASLVSPEEDREQDMLHDEFFESYHDYEELTRRRMV